MPRAALISFVAAICGLALLAPAAGAFPAEYAGSSTDGEEVFFTTAAKLVPGDTDNGFVDVYERFFDNAPGIETYVTREISTGPIGGSDSYDVVFDGVSSNGTKAVFSTEEPLVEADQDKARDIYERNTVTGETILVSGGSTTATFVGMTPDGAKVFFTTAAGLTAGDVDEETDVYVRDIAKPGPELATPGGAAPVTFDGASSDGTRVAFETTDSLDAADTDGEADIYERDLSAGTTKLASGNTCPSPLPASECVPIYRGIAADGSVFLQTRTQLTVGDQDTFQDVYEWSSSTATSSLVSTGDEGEEGQGEHNAAYAGAAGGAVFFETDESLAATDSDNASDVYARNSGTTSLVSPGTAEVPAIFNGASADGSIVLFSTREALAGGDSGSKLDVYAHSGVTTTLVTPGSAEFDATLAGFSSDATDLFYVTSQKVLGADLDELADIYEVSEGGVPVLVSSGPAGGNGSFVAHLVAVSEGGDHAFFTTKERLTVDDNFALENDVYDHAPSGTLLVSVGNSGEVQLGPPAPSVTATNPGSPGASTEPRVIGEAELGTSVKIYATADCSGAPAKVGPAAEFDSAGLPVVVKTGATTTFHATATNAAGDTSACSATAVSYAQQNVTPPPPVEEPSGGTGSGGSGGTGGAGGGSGSSSGSGSGGIKVGGVVYVAPQTRITFGPLSKTRSRRPVFRFIDATEQPNTKFFCRIDHKAWKGCGSPYRAKPLRLGKHVFAVKGKSFAGQWEQRPVTRRFKVVAP